MPFEVTCRTVERSEDVQVDMSQIEEDRLLDKWNLKRAPENKMLCFPRESLYFYLISFTLAGV